LVKVSAVIPAYNASATISEAVMSALSQSHQDVEVIVCDDASIDDTCDVVDSIKDDRIILLSNETNRGSGFSRDRAIAAAGGDFIAMLDADDAWLPQRVSRLLDAVDGHASTMVFDDIAECRESGNGLVARWNMRGADAFGARGQPVDVAAQDWVASKRLLIKPLIPTAPLRHSGVRHSARTFGEDTEFVLKLVSNGLRLRYVPEATYKYRTTRTSASSVRTRHEQMLEILEAAKDMFGMDRQMLAALDWRIAYEKHLQAYFEFLWAVKSLDFGRSFGLALSNPGVLSEFASRSIRDVAFRLR
jgi:glycosyltransferase involved in cell wall biosynthesis